MRCSSSCRIGSARSSALSLIVLAMRACIRAISLRHRSRVSAGSIRFESEDAKRMLPALTLERWRSEIARMQARIAKTMRESALERALPILQELEQRIASKFFDDHQPAYRV